MNRKRKNVSIILIMKLDITIYQGQANSHE